VAEPSAASANPRLRLVFLRRRKGPRGNPGSLGMALRATSLNAIFCATGWSAAAINQRVPDAPLGNGLPMRAPAAAQGFRPSPRDFRIPSLVGELLPAIYPIPLDRDQRESARPHVAPVAGIDRQRAGRTEATPRLLRR